MASFTPPLGSSSPEVLADNATRLDKLINGEELTVPDRSGEALKSWAGIQADSAARLEEIDTIITSLDTANFTFASDVAGLAATTEGQYFRAFQDINGFVLFRYYQNVSGAAVFKGSLLGNAASEELAALLSSVSYLAGNEFDTDKQYPVVDSNKRLLCWWMGSDYYIPGSIHAGGIDTKLLSLDGYEYPTRFVKNSGEFEDDIVLARLDANNRILEVIRKDGYFTTAQQLGDRRTLMQVGDGEYETDFNYAMLDANYRIIILRTNDGVINGGITREAEETEDGLFIGEVVLDGTRLLQSDADTGKQRVLVESSTIGSVLNRVDDGYYQFTDTADADAIGKLLYSPYGVYDPRAKFGRKSISLYGHSFFGNNQKMSGDLSTMTGLKVYNFARSGATSRAIALRFDAYRLKYTPVGGIIPASGSVDFVEADAGPLQVVGNGAIADQLQVTYAGVRGYVVWNGSKMTFTRSEAGSVVSVSAADELVVLTYTSVLTPSVPLGTNYPGARESIIGLWLSRNSIFSILQAESDLRAIIKRMTSLNIRMFVCPEFTQTTETTGTSGYNAVMAMNAMYKRVCPELYVEIDGVDLLQNFRNHYNPDLPDDVAAFNAGTVPPSLLNVGDPLHPSNAGIAVNSAFVDQFLNNLGWTK